MKQFLLIFQLKRTFKKFVFEPKESNIRSALNSLTKVLLNSNSQMLQKANVEYSGWLSKSSELKLLKNEIQLRNLEYKISIRRHIRRELIRNFRYHGLFPGYRVIFRPISAASHKLDTPIFFASDSNKTPFLPVGSNKNSVFVIDRYSLENDHFLNSGICVPGHFYLDMANLAGSTFIFPFQSWLYKNLDHVIDLLRYVQAPKLSSALLEFLPESIFSLRNLDRLNFLIHGEQAEIKSDLILLGVEKSLSKLEILDSQPFVELTKVNNLVDFRATTNVMKVPKAGFNLIQDVLLVEGCQVIKDGNLLIIEDAADPSRDFVSGQWSYLFSGRVQANHVLIDRTFKPTQNLKSGILIGGRNETNWYHWVIEYVSRIAIDTEIPGEVPLLVSENVPVAFHDVIRRVSARKIISLSNENDWSVQNLYVAQPLLQILDSTVIPWDQGVSSNYAALNVYRKKTLSGLSGTSNVKKIFLTRVSGHRGVTNQDELVEVALRHGFTSVDPSTLTWVEQLVLFQNAEVIVGPSGAVMANYFFASSKCKILALTNKHLYNFVLPGLIASYSGAKFQYLLGKPVLKKYRTSFEKMHSDFTISKNKFEKALASLESHTTLNS